MSTTEPNIPANPRCIVVMDGHRFDSFDPETIEERLESVSVELSTNRSSECEFRVFDPKFKIQAQFASMVSGHTPDVSVYMGYGDDLGAPVFQGMATQQERDDQTTGFVAYDYGFKMKKLKNAEYHYKMDDKDIISKLTARNGLGVSFPSGIRGLEKYKVMMQDEQTDWQHVMERAKEIGWIVYVRNRTLYLRYPARVTPPIATFINKKDFHLKHGFDFTFRIPESQEGKRLVTRRGRGKGGKQLAGTSDISAAGKEAINLKKDTPGKHTKAKLEVRAQAQKDLEREHAFEGSIKALIRPGAPRIDVRDTIKVLEIGPVYSGAYICDGVRYEFSPGLMEIELDLFRDVN